MRSGAISWAGEGGRVAGHETCPTQGREARTVKPKGYEPSDTVQEIERGCPTFAHWETRADVDRT